MQTSLPLARIAPGIISAAVLNAGLMLGIGIMLAILEHFMHGLFQLVAMHLQRPVGWLRHLAALLRLLIILPGIHEFAPLKTLPRLSSTIGRRFPI